VVLENEYKPLSNGSYGAPQSCTEESSIASYDEIEAILKNKTTQVYWDRKTESRYACNIEKDIWISYDDKGV
jgi:GH18 family chitinase